ncbi:hypothetical protein [Kineococcus sp. SYSU DK006]|uniref:hypothetical protein n=1 Tax=Kineococcus sp. SYSU DK006 TaxID=3383127 RepID=UPI003D7C9681
MRTPTALTLTAAAALVALTACSSGSSTGDDDAPTITTSPTPSQGAPAPGGATDPPTVTASPDAAQAADLTTRVQAIAPGLGTDQQQLVEAAVELCQDSARGVEDRTLAGNAVEALGTGGTTLTEDQGLEVVAAVRESFCHG